MTEAVHIEIYDREFIFKAQSAIISGRLIQSAETRLNRYCYETDRCRFTMYCN